MNGKVYEYNEYYKEDYDLTKREFETNIRKDSIDVTIEDIIDDLIIFGYDYKHHYASDAHYVLLGINKDIIIDLNNSISKNRHQKLEELSPEEQARIKEMKEKFIRWLELE